jgi:septal ring factor EnvC (AmiA/AmiB activator)
MPEEIPTNEPNTPTPDLTPSPEAPPPAPQAQTPEEIERLQANVSQFRQYEKQYKSQIAEMKKQLDAYKRQQADHATAEADAEKARLVEQEKWKELAEKAQGENADLAKRLEAMEAQLTESARRTLANRIAVSLGAVNPDDLNFASAVMDIDMSGADAEAQIKSAIEAMKESHAYLFKSAEPEKPPMPGLPGFNPSGDGAQLTDAQRIARLKQLTGQGHWGMFGSQTKQTR